MYVKHDLETVLLAPLDGLLDIRVGSNRVRFPVFFLDSPEAEWDSDVIEPVRFDFDDVRFGDECIPARHDSG